MPDDDDRLRDASSAADPGWAAAAAPDDISELARDIASYHREQRAARRRERLRRLYARPGATPMSLTVAALAVAAIAATLLMFMQPSSGRVSSLPLAHSTATIGTQGGLLPDVALTDITGTSSAARGLRPAAMAVIPQNCGCQALLSTIAGDASVVQQLRTYVVAPAAPDAEATALGGRINSAAVYYDGTGALHQTFSGSGVTVVLLNRDGTIFRVLPRFDTVASHSLVPLLQQMLQGTHG